MKKLNVLTRMLLLVALLVGSVSVWGEDVAVTSGTFNGKDGVYTTGWSTNGTGKGRTDCIIIGKGENITSPSLDLSGYTKITITFTGRRYGTLTGSKATVDASIGGSSKGTIDITNGSVGTVSGNINFVPTDAMTAVNIVFTCTNATSAGSTHGAGIGSITIKGTPKSPVTSIDAEDVIVDYNAVGGTIESKINNPVDGGVLTAAKKTTADWLTLGSVSGTNVPFTTTTNDGNEDREATVTLTYTYGDPESTVTKDVTITQSRETYDYATLPFNWDGGTKSELEAVTGVEEVVADNKDYAEENAPYRIKFNDTGKYITIHTNEQPGTVTIGVKMIGGNKTSTITVQESADGTSFTKVQDLSISGSTDDVVNLATTTSFKSTTRYVKLYYTKGSNVGVGPITISKASVTVTIGTSGFASYCSTNALDFTDSDVNAYAAKVSGANVVLTKVDKVPANEGVVLYCETSGNYDIPVIATADDVENNEMVGIIEETTVVWNPSTNVYNYILQQGVFKKAAEAGAKLRANRAYLSTTYNVGSSAKPLTIVFNDDEQGEETDGIKAISTKVENGVRYNLAGQRVGNDYKGIVVVNGKKMLNK